MRGTCAPAEVCAYPQADAELSRVPQPGLSWLELPLHSRLRFVAIGLRRLCLREVAESRDCDADRGVDKNEVDDHREEKAKVDRLTTYSRMKITPFARWQCGGDLSAVKEHPTLSTGGASEAAIPKRVAGGGLGRDWDKVSARHVTKPSHTVGRLGGTELPVH